jgi:hypothetical protein
VDPEWGPGGGFILTSYLCTCLTAVLHVTPSILRLFFLRHPLFPWGWRRSIPPNSWYLSARLHAIYHIAEVDNFQFRLWRCDSLDCNWIGLHGVTPRKTTFLLVTAVRTPKSKSLILYLYFYPDDGDIIFLRYERRPARSDGRLANCGISQAGQRVVKPGLSGCMGPASVS